MTRFQLIRVLRWFARIWGTAVVLFILYFLLSDVFGPKEPGYDAISVNEVFTFICFPLLPIIGLTLAWKWEGPGGIIALIGMIGLPILRPDLLPNYPLIALVMIPGIIYIWLWWVERKRGK